MMFAKFSKQHEVGATPGALVQSEHAIESKASVIQYSRDGINSKSLESIDQIPDPDNEGSVIWIDIQGLANHEWIQALGERFDLHPLLLSDIVNVPQRPKADSYAQQILLVVRMARTDDEGHLSSEQVSLVIGKGYVLSFQEEHGDVWEPVRNRMQDPKSRLRNNGAAYLAYALLDTIIDGYYPVLESVGDQIEILEQQVMSDSKPALLQELNILKNHLNGFRRITWPHRDAISSLMRDDHEWMDEHVQLYLRDTYDHCIQTTEVLESYRENVSGLMNLYLSNVANKTNEVMKVLTVVSSIFIPLTFIAGVYGMNFENMPELSLTWTYPAVLCTMLVIASGMTAFFWSKGWIRWGTKS